MGLSTNNLFNTECLVWCCIPNYAIIACWKWGQIHNTLDELFPPLVKECFTICDGMHYRPLHELCNSLATLPPIKVREYIRVLIDKFNLARAALVTKQLVLIMANCHQLPTIPH